MLRTAVSVARAPGGDKPDCGRTRGSEKSLQATRAVWSFETESVAGGPAERVWISAYIASTQTEGGEVGRGGSVVDGRFRRRKRMRRRKSNLAEADGNDHDRTQAASARGDGGETKAGDVSSTGVEGRSGGDEVAGRLSGVFPRRPPPQAPSAVELEREIMYLQALQSAIWAKGDRGDPEVERSDERELRQSKQRVAALQRVHQRQCEKRARLTALESSLRSAQAAAAECDAEVGRMEEEVGKREAEVEEAVRRLREAQEGLDQARQRESGARATLQTAGLKARSEHMHCQEIECALGELCKHVALADEILQDHVRKVVDSENAFDDLLPETPPSPPLLPSTGPSDVGVSVASPRDLTPGKTIPESVSAGVKVEVERGQPGMVDGTVAVGAVALKGEEGGTGCEGGGLNGKEEEEDEESRAGGGGGISRANTGGGTRCGHARLS